MGNSGDRQNWEPQLSAEMGESQGRKTRDELSLEAHGEGKASCIFQLAADSETLRCKGVAWSEDGEADTCFIREQVTSRPFQLSVF